MNSVEFGTQVERRADTFVQECRTMLERRLTRFFKDFTSSCPCLARFLLDE